MSGRCCTCWRLERDGSHGKGCPLATPVPSEVAETTAGEREACPHAGRPHNLTECVYGDCFPAEPDAGEVEALAKVIGAEVWRIHGPESTDEDSAAMDGEDIARAVIASDWLAALLDRVRRDEGAKALREAAEAIVLPGSESGGFYAGEVDAGYREAERHAEDWLRARAASVGRGEGQ